MALVKRKVRKKLSKQLKKVVKRHGPEVALALVGGIISSFQARAKKPVRRQPARAPAAAADHRREVVRRPR